MNSAPLLELTDEGGLRVSSGVEHEEDRAQGDEGEEAAERANKANESNDVNETDKTDAEKGERGVKVEKKRKKSMKGGFALNLRPCSARAPDITGQRLNVCEKNRKQFAGTTADDKMYVKKNRIQW
ncbi:hypothetical protein ACFTAO_49910 [Paenibacillus rhizoplanae]